MQTAQIVSPPFSCGVTWLINALLHLNIRVSNTNFEPDHWHQKNKRWKISPEAKNHLKWHLPVLHEREFFSFSEKISVRWEHRLDFAASSGRPTILFIRDPRDAVYSLYRRNHSENISFESYLNKPDEWPDHFPGLFHLPPLETFWLFCEFWIAMGEVMPVKIIRFEDSKSAPEKTIQEVLSFLNISRTSKQITTAIESSTFEKAKKAMENMEISTGKTFKTTRLGKTQEWRTAYSFLAKCSIRRGVRNFIHQYGYKSALPRLFFRFKPGPYLSEYGGLQLSKRANLILRKWISNTESEKKCALPKMPFDLKSLKRQELLLAGAILEAVYWVDCIFPQKSTPQARIALKLFCNFNLTLLKSGFGKILAWRSLDRVNLEGQLDLENRLGAILAFCVKKLCLKLWQSPNRLSAKACLLYEAII